MPLFTQPCPVLIICTCFIIYPDLYQRKAFYDQFVLPPDSLALPVNLLPKHAPWQKLHGIILIWIILEDLDHGAHQEAHPSIIRPIFLLTLHHLLVLPHPPKTYLSSTGQLPLNPSPAQPLIIIFPFPAGWLYFAMKTSPVLEYHLFSSNCSAIHKRSIFLVQPFALCIVLA